MKIKRYIISAVVLILLVYIVYFVNFSTFLGYELSNDSAIWGQFGNYIGGILNPLLSFLSIVLLIKSLVLQYEANNSLKKELEHTEKTEKLRSFEILFFNLIDSQKNLFDSFEISFPTAGERVPEMLGVKAVIELESRISRLKDTGASDSAITEYLAELDVEDQLFGVSRAFYIIVMIITDKLNSASGFTSSDRETHFKALINFTNFAQLRLIMICVQFLDYESARYLNSAEEFKKVVEDVGLSYKIY